MNQPTTTTDNVHTLARITAASNRRACLYAAPVLARAAALLRDLVATGRRHGVPADTWDVDLAGACLDAVSQTVKRMDQMNDILRPARAEALLDAVVVALAEQDPPVRARRDGWTVTLITGPDPKTGYRRPLVLSCTAGSGWDLTFDRPGGGMSPAALICAGFDLADAGHVADIVARVNRGEAGDPFGGRR